MQMFLSLSVALFAGLMLSRVAKEFGAISPSLIERRLGLSYNKALKIIKMLDEKGLLAPSEGRGKPRKLK